MDAIQARDVGALAPALLYRAVTSRLDPGVAAFAMTWGSPAPSMATVATSSLAP